MRGIRLSDRVLIAGQTGKGKTTLADYLVARMQPVRVIVFDPKGELQFAGVEPCRTPDALAAAMNAPVVHYIPASFDRDSLEEACEIVWNTPGPYIWWIDETSEISTPSWCPAGLRLGVTQGRQLEKMVLALTQRLAEIHPVFRSQAEHVIIFTPAPIELDLKTVAGHVRREARVLDAELSSLHAEHGDFSHLWYIRDTDELRRCAPLPLQAGRGQPRPTASAAVAESAESAPSCDSDSS